MLKKSGGNRERRKTRKIKRETNRKGRKGEQERSQSALNWVGEQASEEADIGCWQSL